MAARRPELQAVGAAGAAVRVRTDGRECLFNGATGALLPRVDRRLSTLLDALAPHGGWTPEAEHAITEGRPVPPALARIVDRYLRPEPPPRPDHLERAPAVTSLIVYPAAACNLACSYCLNAGGTFGQARRGIMNGQTVEALVAWVRAETRLASRITVTLIGGEPTLAPTCTALIDGLCSIPPANRDVRLKLSTNGVDVAPAVLEACRRHRDRVTIGLSIDGDAARHDRHRVDHRGEGTHARAVAFLEQARAAGLSVSLTAVVTPPYDFVGVDAALTALGADFVEVKAMEPAVHNALDSDGHSYADALYDDWLRGTMAYADLALARVADAGADLAMPHRHLVRQVLGGARGDAASCDAGGALLAVDPGGALYACDRFFGREGFGFGTVREGIDPVRLTAYRTMLAERGRLVATHPDCRACMAREACRGGCYGENLHRSGRIDAIAAAKCDRRRARMAVEVDFVARLAVDHPDVFTAWGGRLNG